MKAFVNIFFIILTSLMVISCNSDKKEWNKCQEDRTFLNVFKFSFNYRESIYLDSAVSFLNSRLKDYKSFNIRFYGDSITYDDYGNTHRDYSKSNVIAYNLTNGDLLYRDSLFINVTTTEKYLRSFIKQNELSKYHCIFVYPDTLYSNDSWIDMFGKIDYLLSIYYEQRNNYSKQIFHIDYNKLPREKRLKIDRDLPINLFLSYNKQIPYYWSKWFKYVEKKE